MSDKIASMARPPSRLVRALEQGSERIYWIQEAMWNPTTSDPGLELGGLGDQDIDDFNDLVEYIRTIEQCCGSMIEAIQAHLQPKGIKVLPDEEDNNGMHLLLPDGSRPLSRAVRQIVMRKR